MKVTHDQLCIAPELALVAALDNLLLLAVRVLHAAHPELLADRVVGIDVLFACDVAPRVLDAVELLRRALADYHTAVERDLAEAPDNELPF